MALALMKHFGSSSSGGATFFVEVLNAERQNVEIQLVDTKMSTPKCRHN
jgi:hypothetical protein